MRNKSYGQGYQLSLVDKFGVYLSTREVVNFVKKVKPKTIIDIGCGYDAILLQKLKTFSNDLTGVDLDTNKKIKGIKFIDKHVTDNLNFLKTQSADLVILNSVLEHLEFDSEILKEVNRILKKDGWIFINVPSWLGKSFLEFSAFKLGLSPIEEIDDHKMYYNKKDLWPILVKAGFKPKDIKISYHKFFLNTKAYAKKS